MLSCHVYELLNLHRAGRAKEAESECVEKRDCDLRAVMCPLVYSQALMVEWRGLAMPEDPTSL